jgi:hypothetical protein
MRRRASFEEKGNAMRERNSPIDSLASNSTPFGERHYSVNDVAKMWSLSSDTIRGLFDHEPGVLVFTDSKSRHKRRYRTLRIPQSILERVYRRMSRVSQ